MLQDREAATESLGSTEASDTTIGSALVLRAIEHARARGSAELSVSTMPDNAAALRLYRRHGLTDEAVLLERHL